MTFQTLMSVTVIMSDLNIIAVSGVPLHDAMTMPAYKGHCIATIIISSWIVLMYIITLGWWRRNEVVHIVGGKSISKGVGTVGGLMRWLLSGGPEVVEAVGRVKEEREVWGVYRRRNRGEDGAPGTKVWFGRRGVVGGDGRERWCLDFERGHGQETSGMRERRRSSNVVVAQGMAQTQGQRDAYF